MASADHSVSALLRLSVVLAVVATSCSASRNGASAPTGPTTSLSAESNVGESAVTAALAAGGVTVVPIGAPAPVAGGGVIQVTDWQADTWGRQVQTGGGNTGAQLSVEFPVPGDAIPIDAIMAGWLLTATTPASDAARTIVDTKTLTDPDTFVFPAAVIALFGNDVLSPTANADTIGFHRVDREPYTAADPCGALQGLYNATIGQVVNWFQADASDGIVVGLLKGAARAVGAFLSAAVVAAVNTFLGPILIPIKAAIAAISVAVALGASLTPWTVAVTPDVDSIDYGVDPKPGNQGSFVVTVTSPLGSDWPAAVQSCAQLANVTLPDLNPVGTGVAWTPSLNELANQTADDVTHTASTLGGTAEVATAKFVYTTNTESQDEAQNGSPDSGPITATAEIQRDAAAELQKVLQPIVDDLTKPLPKVVRDIIDNEAAPFLYGLATGGSPKKASDRSTTVNFHDTPPTTTTPPPTDPPAQTPTTLFQLPPPATFSGAYSGTIDGAVCGTNGATVNFDVGGDQLYFGQIGDPTTIDSHSSMIAPPAGSDPNAVAFLWAQTGGTVHGSESPDNHHRLFDVTGVTLTESQSGDSIVLDGTVSCP